jgi:hypothetical protein
MRLTSTGLGIGTSSPGAKLHIKQASADTTGLWVVSSANDSQVRLYNNGTVSAVSSTYQSTGSYMPLTFLTSDTERMRLDTSGNLGLGVTPSAWNTNLKAIDIKAVGNSIMSGGSSDMYVTSNAYFNASNSWIYANTAAASIYQLASGQHRWSVAASGTAGNAISFTQAMTLDADGDLGIGTTSPAAKVHSSLSSSGATSETLRLDNPSDSANAGTKLVYRLSGWSFDGGFASLTRDGSSGGTIMAFGTSANASTTNATERARIDSSGNLLVGLTSLFDAERLSVVGANTQRAVYFKNDTAATTNTLIHNAATTGDNVFIGFGTEAAYTGRGSITYNRAGGLVAYNVTSDYRAKDISGPVTGSGALIDSIPVYMGTMKGATQERPMFIAHEVPAYAHTGEKDAVDADGNPVYQQMDASALIPVMWAEIQSLRQRLSAANL